MFTTMHTIRQIAFNRLDMCFRNMNDTPAKHQKCRHNFNLQASVIYIYRGGTKHLQSGSAHTAANSYISGRYSCVACIGFLTTTT